jgi:hypothetical protein
MRELFEKGISHIYIDVVYHTVTLLGQDIDTGFADRQTFVAESSGWREAIMAAELVRR